MSQDKLNDQPEVAEVVRRLRVWGGQVMISMSKELPVVVQYRIEDMGHIR